MEFTAKELDRLWWVLMPYMTAEEVFMLSTESRHKLTRHFAPPLVRRAGLTRATKLLMAGHPTSTDGGSDA